MVQGQKWFPSGEPNTNNFDRFSPRNSQLARAAGSSIIPGRVGSPSGDQTGIRWGQPKRARANAGTAPATV